MCSSILHDMTCGAGPTEIRTYVSCCQLYSNVKNSLKEVIPASLELRLQGCMQLMNMQGSWHEFQHGSSTVCTRHGYGFLYLRVLLDVVHSRTTYNICLELRPDSPSVHHILFRLGSFLFYHISPCTPR